jgi:hypothetical protein
MVLKVRPHFIKLGTGLSGSKGALVNCLAWISFNIAVIFTSCGQLKKQFSLN